MTVAPATVAIVGSGALARAHARVVVAHPDLRLVAIVDQNEASGLALIEKIVRRFEGERAPLFADLDSALAAADVDVLAIAEATPVSADAAVAAGKVVLGGNPGPEAGKSGRWFAFDDALSVDRTGTGDAAFADHLRQYESLLGSIGRGPLALTTGANA